MNRLSLMFAGLCVLFAAICATALWDSGAHGQTIGTGVVGGGNAWAAPDGRSVNQLIEDHVLPDPTKTPGVINANAPALVTVCKAGWTAAVRPPEEWTDRLRAADTPAGHKPGEGELDHLISIEDLGAPADPQNLWWMVYADRYGARVKDVLETKLHKLLCAGKITVAQAQAALVSNWLIGYRQYVGPLP